MKHNKILSSFRWYRRRIGGTWYCYLSNISQNGFYRKWSQIKPKKRQKLNIPTTCEDLINIAIVEVEYYGLFEYKWVMPKSYPICVNKGWGKLIKVYYNNHIGLFETSSLYSKDITPSLDYEV